MRWMGALTTTLALLVGMGTAHADKPLPDLQCSVQFRDAVGDAIRSDGGGKYVDGVAGVSCGVAKFTGWLSLQLAVATRKTPGSTRSIVFGLQPIATQNTGVASLNLPGGPPSGTSQYTTFASGGGTAFEIKFLSNATEPLNVRPLRARLVNSQFMNNFGQFDGDSGQTGTPLPGISSLFVAPIVSGTVICGWVATFYSTYGEQPWVSSLENATTQQIGPTDPRFMVLHESTPPIAPDSVLRGYFSVPFQATIRVNNPGCPAL